MGQQIKPRALVVDDEAHIRELLDEALDGMGVQTIQAATLSEARQILNSREFDFCLTDLRLPDGSGLDLVGDIAKRYARTPIAVITAYGSVETAVEALKKGAFDFINKPIELNNLRNLTRTALDLIAADKCESRERSPNTGLIGKTGVMEDLRGKIEKLSRSMAPVCITGESGTGKELVARLIHEQGRRADAPFIPVNCGAIPVELVESELFGHQKGSFTGAVRDQSGLFQEADGGTLFLDEVADLPQGAQVKLLRVIQERAVRSVGGRQEESIDVRILSATNSDLREKMRHGVFREDLFYRLNVIELHVPPLRERMTDIPLLAEHIQRRLARRNGITPLKLSTSALERLMEYDFPGNVRELENVIERASAWAEGEQIGTADLVLENSVSETRPPLVATGRFKEKPFSEEQTAGQPNYYAGGAKDLEYHLVCRERELVTRALEETRWNRTAAAKKLGITLRALRYRIKKLGLE